MNVVIEVVVAILVTYVSIIVLGYLELDFMKIEFEKGFKVLITILIILLIVEFTAFSFYLPWHDVLTDPYA
jgi:hypothetical protein